MKFREFKTILSENARFEVPYNQDLVGKIESMDSSYVEPKKNIHLARNLIMSVSFTILLVLTFVGVMINNQVSYVISLDINPSVNLEVNRFGKVISIEPNNEDGEFLVSQTNFDGMNYLDVIDSLYLESITLGFSTSNSAFLLFGVSSKDYEKEQTLSNSITEYLSADSINMLIVSKHSSIEYTLYSGMASDFLSNSDTDNFTTTTAYLDSSSIDTPLDGIPEYYDRTYVILNSLTSVQYTNLAKDLDITEAKLQIVLSVYFYYSSIQNGIGLDTLAQMNLSDLFVLYQTIPS